MMKWNISIILFLLPIWAISQIEYDRYFTNITMRFDFILAGNSTEVQIFPQQIKKEGPWAGPRVHLTNTLNYGTYRFRLLDAESKQLLFCKGFCPLFQEWQSTDEARQQNRSFYQALLFPVPKHKIFLEVDTRQWDGTFNTIFHTIIDPDNFFIVNEQPLALETFDIINNGAPQNKVDLVILAEGYTRAEKNKFKKDAVRMTQVLFNAAPFNEEKQHFNVRAVFSPSEESGTDVPGERIYKNTVFNSSFYTFNTPRYLTVTDMKPVYDAAASVPYDHIYILVNTDRYGGGGFYNFVSVCTADNELTPQVFVHEFGHAFAGLGDEYYTSGVAYSEFYNTNTEPWEPNLTTLVSFEKKWAAMVNDTTPIPTPRASQYSNIVGVFEGGGYSAKGIYSPQMDCRMKSNQAKGFCSVCEEAVRRAIRFYCDE